VSGGGGGGGGGVTGPGSLHCLARRRAQGDRDGNQKRPELEQDNTGMETKPTVGDSYTCRLLRRRRKRVRRLQSRHSSRITVRSSSSLSISNVPRTEDARTELLQQIARSDHPYQTRRGALLSRCRAAASGEELWTKAKGARQRQAAHCDRLDAARPGPVPTRRSSCWASRFKHHVTRREAAEGSSPQAEGKE